MQNRPKTSRFYNTLLIDSTTLLSPKDICFSTLHRCQFYANFTHRKANFVWFLQQNQSSPSKFLYAAIREWSHTNAVITLLINRGAYCLLRVTNQIEVHLQWRDHRLFWIYTREFTSQLSIFLYTVEHDICTFVRNFKFGVSHARNYDNFYFSTSISR